MPAPRAAQLTTGPTAKHHTASGLTSEAPTSRSSRPTSARVQGSRRYPWATGGTPAQAAAATNVLIVMLPNCCRPGRSTCGPSSASGGPWAAGRRWTQAAREGKQQRVRRDGSGPPVLLLHGHPRTHVTWHKVAPILAERFTVVCPDLRGYGESSSRAYPVSQRLASSSELAALPDGHPGRGAWLFRLASCGQPGRHRSLSTAGPLCAGSLPPPG